VNIVVVVIVLVPLEVIVVVGKVKIVSVVVGSVTFVVKPVVTVVVGNVLVPLEVLVVVIIVLVPEVAILSTVRLFTVLPMIGMTANETITRATIIINRYDPLFSDIQFNLQVF